MVTYVHMSQKTNFLITKKFLAKYMGITRTTLDKRLIEVNIDLNSGENVLDWVIFEGMNNFAYKFSQYVYKRKGEKCEECGTKYNLTIAHIIPRAYHEFIFKLQNVKVLCSDCHRLYDELHPRSIMPVKNPKHLSRKEEKAKIKNRIDKLTKKLNSN